MADVATVPPISNSPPLCLIAHITNKAPERVPVGPWTTEIGLLIRLFMAPSVLLALYAGLCGRNSNKESEIGRHNLLVFFNGAPLGNYIQE
jgi:hypothetical protein